MFPFVLGLVWFLLPCTWYCFLLFSRSCSCSCSCFVYFFFLSIFSLFFKPFRQNKTHPILFPSCLSAVDQSVINIRLVSTDNTRHSIRVDEGKKGCSLLAIETQAHIVVGGGGRSAWLVTPSSELRLGREKEKAQIRIK